MPTASPIDRNRERCSNRLMPQPDHPPFNRAKEATRWLVEQSGQFDQLVSSVEDYAIFMMSLDGTILDWNTGAHRLKGYRADEIVGQNFARFYGEEDLARKLPEMELEIAYKTGKFADEG